jgi:hypothetical protein
MTWKIASVARTTLVISGIAFSLSRSSALRAIIDANRSTPLNALLLFIDLQLGLLPPFYILSILDHKWLLENGTFPYAYHPDKNVGRQGFNLQLALYETFHSTAIAQIIHGLVLPIQQACWLYLIPVLDGKAGGLGMALFLVVQAISYHDTVFTIFIILVNLGLYSLNSTLVSLLPYAINTGTVKIILFSATLFEVISHSEEQLPPTTENTGFGEIATSQCLSAPCNALKLLALGFISELAAGVPGRLFNVLVYKILSRLGMQSESLMRVGEAKRRGRAILRGGWGADELTRDLMGRKDRGGMTDEEKGAGQ